jgi:hypothetical protein
MQMKVQRISWDTCNVINATNNYKFNLEHSQTVYIYWERNMFLQLCNIWVTASQTEQELKLNITLVILMRNAVNANII